METDLVTTLFCEFLLTVSFDRILHPVLRLHRQDVRKTPKRVAKRPIHFDEFFFHSIQVFLVDRHSDIRFICVKDVPRSERLDRHSQYHQQDQKQGGDLFVYVFHSSFLPNKVNSKTNRPAIDRRSGSQRFPLSDNRHPDRDRSCFGPAYPLCRKYRFC